MTPAGVPPGKDPGTCLVCHAPKPHPKSPCVLCGAEHDHVAGTSVHLTRDHDIRGGSRKLALALDYSRAVVRRWPSEAPLARFREFVGASA